MGTFAKRDLSFCGRSRTAVSAGFARALEAAEAFAGATAPNPPVGCALLDLSGDIIAVGAHRRAGTFHAEASAIAQAEAAGRINDIRTVLVTLEPCNHTGRTPPCSEAILKTPAVEVWIGALDPNPRVEGGGAERLSAAGLKVRNIAELDGETGANFAKSATRLVAPFAHHALTGLPYVTVKQAFNRQGTMLPAAGQKTFTTAHSLKSAHLMRRRAGAIITGSGTVLADDPSFTVRLVPDFEHVQRRLLILDRRGRVPQAYMDAAAERGFIVSRETSIEAALEALGVAGVIEVLVEAGPLLSQEFLDAGMWNEHVRFVQADEGQPDVVDRRYRNADERVEE